MAATTEEPILSRLDRLDTILRQLEDIRGGNRTPKSSCASTATSGTLTSEGHRSSFDFSPRSIEKHCRPINDVIVETEHKGTLIQRLLHVEERVLKLGLELEKEMEGGKKIREDDEVTSTPDSRHEHDEDENGTKKKKKGLKQLVKSCVTRKHKTAH